jgi:hypothetical protein
MPGPDPVALQIVWTSACRARWAPGWPVRCWAWPVPWRRGLFRNPLADPYLLGSASGASLGVALSSWHVWRVTVCDTQWLMRLGLTAGAFAGAVAGVLLTLAAGQRRAAHAAPAAGRCHRRRGAGRGQGTHHAGPARLHAVHAGLHAGQHRLCGLDCLQHHDGPGLLCMAVAWA